MQVGGAALTTSGGLRAMSRRLDEAAALARAAVALAEAGAPGRAIGVMLDAEEPLREAGLLLQALALMQRLDEALPPIKA